MADARLTWGATSLVPETYPANAGYVIEASADGTNFGNPEAVVTAIRSSLQDGSLNQITSYQNRAGMVRMRVRSKTYEGLDAGSDALAAEQAVPGYSTLSWTPNAALARATVWDVVYATLDWEFDDLAETKVGDSELYRYFAASFDLLPFGRSQNLTTIQATGAVTTPTTPTTVSIDNGSSTAGWTATNSTGEPGQTSETVGSNGSVVFASGTTPLALRKTTSIPLTTTRYIFVDHSANTPDPSRITGFLLSTANILVPMALQTQLSLPGGLFRSYFAVPASFGLSANGVEFRSEKTSNSRTFTIDQVSRTDALPTLGTNRQRTRSLQVGGSARARASLIITAPSGATLGDLTILYTRTATTGLQPPLRQYRSTGPAITTDAATLSGAYGSVGTTSPTVFLIPANRIREAAHLLAARLRSTSAGTFTVSWSVALATSANADLPETAMGDSGSTTVSFAAANTWQANPLGLLQLPTVPVAMDSTHVLRLTVSASSTAVQWDEMWLFDVNNGDLTAANTTGLTRLEVRAADLLNENRTVWGGTADGGGATGLVRADWRVIPVASANNLSLASLGDHDVIPGTVDVFTVTTGTEGSAASASFYTAWLHTAGDEEAA